MGEVAERARVKLPWSYANSRPIKAHFFKTISIFYFMKGGNLMKKENAPVTQTEHKIGNITYVVCSSASERATDTLDKKIKKLIRKDIELKPAKAHN